MGAYDIRVHNDEYAEFLAAKEVGRQPRIEMTLSCNPRIILMDGRLNEGGVTFEQYMGDPDVMLETQCRFSEYVLNELPWDKFMGADENTRWRVYPDFQNVLEPAWFGCPVVFGKNAEPTVGRLLTDENKRDIFKRGLIEPFSGIMGKAAEYAGYFREREKAGHTWNGFAISAAESFGLGTDGPMTIACSLRGAAEFCADLYEDAAYALELLDFITESVTNRIKTFNRYFGLPEVAAARGVTDDCISLLSSDDYKKYVLPSHKKLVAALSEMREPGTTHLCGDAARHFVTMRDELFIGAFDTGFPVDHGALVREVGEGVMIYGGVHVNTLLNGSADDVTAETRQILEDVLPCKNFVMKEANNLCPGTPPENIAAMYGAVKEYGRFYF